MEYRRYLPALPPLQGMQVGSRAGTFRSENGKTGFGVIEITRIGLRRGPRIYAFCWHMAVLSI